MGRTKKPVPMPDWLLDDDWTPEKRLKILRQIILETPYRFSMYPNGLHPSKKQASLISVLMYDKLEDARSAFNCEFNIR